MENMILDKLSQIYIKKLNNTPVIRREIYDILWKNLQKHNIVLIGLRQTGKTTLSEQLLKEFIKTNDSFKNESQDLTNKSNAADQDIFYISLKALGKTEPEILIDYISSNNFKIVFIDEIQTIDKWSNFAKEIIDLMPNTKFIFTGSNAKALNHEIIFNRAKVFYINPLSYLEFKNIWKIGDIDTYFKYGSYPKFRDYEVPSIQYLDTINQQIIDKIIFYDSSKSVDENKFKFLMKKFKNNLGQLVKFDKLKSDSISSPTVKNYFSIMEESRLLKRIWKFGDMNTKRKGKIYFMDKSMIYLFNEHNDLNSLQMGNFIENLVFNYLDNCFNNKLNFEKISFYRSEEDREIDFIIEDAKLLIEVKHNDTLDKDLFISQYGVRIPQSMNNYKKICITPNLNEKYNGWHFISVKALLQKGVEKCLI